MNTLLCETIQNFGLGYWIPIATSFLISIVLAIWNYKQQKGIEKLKKENEKQLHIHRLQFDKEFNIYSELWSKLVDIRAIIVKLRPEVDSIDPKIGYDKTIENRLDEANKIGNNIIDSIEKNKPFYAKNLYNELSKIIKLLRTEMFEVRHGKDNTVEYWENGKKNREEFFQITDVICETIRERIGNTIIK